VVDGTGVGRAFTDMIREAGVTFTPVTITGGGNQSRGDKAVDSHSKRDTVRIGWDRDLDALLWTFNTTPRKCLAFQTPLEAFARQLGVALET
jgi:hypothetical protein